MTDTCFICSKHAETDEHIFPKWLQHKYQLWDQKISLPNETKIPYRQLKIPCCGKCNNEILSQLEMRIESQQATEIDLWMWGAKIHYGLLKKDDFLDWDRKNPGYKIGDVIRVNDPLELNRHLVHSIHGDFITNPDPFGSVFMFNFSQEEKYHFVHLLNPNGICICLGNVGYVLFIDDAGRARRQVSVQEAFKKYSRQSSLVQMLNFFANTWVYLYRFKVSLPLMLSRKSIAVLGSPKLIEEIPFDDDMYAKLWQYITDNPENTLVSTEEFENINGIA